MFKTFVILIILLVVILILIATFKKYSGNGNESNDNIENSPLLNDKKEGYDPDERQVDVYKMINTPTTNIAYNVNEKRAGPFNMPLYGDVPIKSSIIGEDIRGMPKPLLDKIARMETDRDPDSLQRSAQATLRGTLNNARGLCNQNYSHAVAHQVGKSRGEPNRLFMDSYKHNFGTLANKRSIGNKSSAQIMFGQKYGFPDENY